MYMRAQPSQLHVGKGREVQASRAEVGRNARQTWCPAARLAGALPCSLERHEQPCDHPSN